VDRIKNAATDQLNNADDMLKGIQFPAGKDDVLNQLQQRGVPSQVLDKVRNAGTDRFTNPQELKSLLQNFAQ
jgi:hypothetical protein